MRLCSDLEVPEVVVLVLREEELRSIGQGLEGGSERGSVYVGKTRPRRKENIIFMKSDYSAWPGAETIRSKDMS